MSAEKTKKKKKEREERFDDTPCEVRSPPSRAASCATAQRAGQPNACSVFQNTAVSASGGRNSRSLSGSVSLPPARRARRMRGGECLAPSASLPSSSARE